MKPNKTLPNEAAIERVIRVLYETIDSKRTLTAIAKESAVSKEQADMVIDALVDGPYVEVWVTPSGREYKGLRWLRKNPGCCTVALEDDGSFIFLKRGVCYQEIRPNQSMHEVALEVVSLHEYAKEHGLLFLDFGLARKPLNLEAALPFLVADVKARLEPAELAD